eukprot:UN03415
MTTIARNCTHGCIAQIDSNGNVQNHNNNQCPNNGNGPHNYQPIQGDWDSRTLFQLPFRQHLKILFGKTPKKIKSV